MSGCLHSPEIVSQTSVIPVLVTGIHSIAFSSTFDGGKREGMDPRHKAEGDDWWFGTPSGKTPQ
jgi:hypothetical protein